MADHRNFDSAGKEDVSSELQQIIIEYNHEKVMALESFGKKEELPTIYRVPDVLHKMNERAYTPSIVAIGPLHRGKEHLQAMEEEKLIYTNFLFYRTGNVQQTRDLCYSAMLEMVSDAKRCYAEDVRLDNISFAEMMLVDGCFMIELFYRCKQYVFDPILTNTFKHPEILQDLILLENQIPFEVLQELFHLTVERIPPENSNGGPSLTECVLSFYWDVTSPEQSNLKKKDHKTTFHVLHLLHSCHLPHEEAEVPPEHYSPPEEAEVPSHHLPPEVRFSQSSHLPWEEAEVSSHDLPPEVRLSQSNRLPPKDADVPSHHLPPEVRFSQSSHLPWEEAKVSSHHLPPEVRLSQSNHLPPEDAEVPSHHLPPEVQLSQSYHLPREEAEVPSHHLPPEVRLSQSNHLPPEDAEVSSHHLPPKVGLSQSYHLPREEAEVPSHHLPREEAEIRPKRSCHLPRVVDIIQCWYDRVVNKTGSLYMLCACQLPKKKKEYLEAEMVVRNFKYSATELDLGGIKFVQLNRPKNKKDIFHVEFLPHVGFWRRGQFKIPPFLVDDFTELFWRNFIAFEQSRHFFTKSCFTSHAIFLNRLINTTEDVQLLEEKGIIVNTMGSPEEVANLFNNLCNNIHTKEFNSTEECKKVIDFHKQFWPKFLVKLRRDYFSNPWTAISVCAAIGLFVLTLLQTIYTMHS